MILCYINVRLKPGNEASLVYRTKNVSAETQQNSHWNNTVNSSLMLDSHHTLNAWNVYLQLL